MMSSRLYQGHLIKGDLEIVYVIIPCECHSLWQGSPARALDKQ